MAVNEELYEDMLSLLASFVGGDDCVYPSDECPSCGVRYYGRKHVEGCLCVQAKEELERQNEIED